VKVFGEPTGELYLTKGFREKLKGKLPIDRINGVGIDTDFGGGCNQKCIQCYKEDPRLPKNKTFISMDKFEKLLFDAKEAKASETYLLGRDTLLHPEIVSMVKSATDIGFDTLVVTNGLMFGVNEHLCRQIADTGSGLVQQIRVIGNDGNTAETLGYVHGIPKPMRKQHLRLVNTAIQRILEYFPADRIVAQCCLNRTLVDAEQVFKVYDFCLRNHLKPVMEVIKPTTGFFERGHPDDLSIEEIADVYREFEKIREKYGYNPAPFNPPSYGNFCHMFRTGVHIGGIQFNEVYACDGQTPFMLGDTQEDSLSKIITSKKRKDFLLTKDNRVGHCLECNLYGEFGSSCDAGCNGANLIDTGCYRSSSTYCPQIIERGIELKHENFVPESCDGCPMESYDICKPREEIPIYLRRGQINLISRNRNRMIKLNGGV
jgi:uncharacterized Fe-S cluster-containing radical SAM superfamily protein